MAKKDEKDNEEPFVDPNSGAAPQPGGNPGPDAAAAALAEEGAPVDTGEEKPAKKTAAKKTAKKSS